MKSTFLAGLAVLILSLAACTSTPVHYHTLLAPSAPMASSEPAVPFLIDVLPVGIPEQLDQPQLIVRQGASGIAVLDGERWAGPLGEELRHALSSELSWRLATRDIAGLPRPDGKPVLRIKLQVRRFDAWPGQKLLLDADWSLALAGARENAGLLCHGQFEEPATGNYPELIQAGQRAVAALATRIATDARGFGGQADCQKASAVAHGN